MWRYGSRFKGATRTQSDLDRVAFTVHGQEISVFNLKETFAESNLPFRMDLFSWDEMSESFRETIQ